jgi:hypothetical protein
MNLRKTLLSMDNPLKEVVAGIGVSKMKTGSYDVVSRGGKNRYDTEVPDLE